MSVEPTSGAMAKVGEMQGAKGKSRWAFPIELLSMSPDPQNPRSPDPQLPIPQSPNSPNP